MLSSQNNLNLNEPIFDPNQFEMDMLNKVDDRVNTKMAQGMKMAINLIVNKFDMQLQK